MLDKILNWFGLIRKSKSVESLLDEYHEWATKQFPNSTCKSSLIGLKREIVELDEFLSKKPTAFRRQELRYSIAYEYIDILMYLLDSARRYGISRKEFFQFFESKLQINKNRSWNINPDKSYSHIK